jgi:NET1-associated nuclear protein 1 (U3 small nucleolar RNA-associated protein 17)
MFVCGIIVQTGQRIRPTSVDLVIEPRNGHVVLNGTPGSLQFYNAYSKKHVQDLAVSQRNLVSRREEEDIPEFYVRSFAFSSDGEWMSTVRVVSLGALSYHVS